MGWYVSNGPDKLASFYPASQFRKTFYRPDVIKRLLEAGSLEKALAQADEERGQRSQPTEVAQVLPPRVRITAPARSGTRLARGALEVRAEASSAGEHPVTSLRLLLDGRPFDPDKSVKRVAEPTLGSVQASWTLEVPSGKHRLTVQATSAASKALSDDVEVLVGDHDAETVKVAAMGHLHVLAIGINAYPGKLKLNSAANDAQAIARVFKDKSGSLFKSVQVKLLLDEDASRDNILNAFRDLRRLAKAGDVVVVFYAGHGVSADEFYVLPVDAHRKNLTQTAISGETLTKELGELPSTTVLILDACFAASIGQKKTRKRSLPDAADNFVRELNYDQGLVLLCGAYKDQEADDGEGNGIFTKALVEGLSGQASKAGQLLLDDDGTVQITALQDYVRRRVRKISGQEQEPTMGLPHRIRSFALSKP
jgi:hypothetical protein